MLSTCGWSRCGDGGNRRLVAVDGVDGDATHGRQLAQARIVRRRVVDDRRRVVCAGQARRIGMKSIAVFGAELGQSIARHVHDRAERQRSIEGCRRHQS